MPNNSVIMVSFAACFTLGLTTTAGDAAASSPNARSLIEQTARVLERIGNTPKHRNGTSALFGRHIRRLLRQSFPDNIPPLPPVLNDPRQASVDPAQMPAPVTQTQPQPAPYTFDMTDDQIIEAINNASASQELFQIDESQFLDWLEWPNTTWG